MTSDDPRFADCNTFNDYLHKAVEMTAPMAGVPTDYFCGTDVMQKED
jgi:hypothetical protein